MAGPLNVLAVNLSIFLYLILSFLFLMGVKIPGELSTDETLYLSEPSIFHGPGVYLVQLYYRYIALSPVVNILIIAPALLFLARFFFRRLIFKDVRLISGLFILAILNPYFIYHSSSYLKDAPLAVFSLLLFLFIKKRDFIKAALVALLLIVMRPPFFMTFFGLSVGVILFRVLRQKYSFVLVLLYGLSSFISILYLVEKTSVYRSLVDVFESVRGGGYTILRFAGDEYWFPVAVLLNPFFSVFSEFLVPQGSMLLLISGTYWGAYMLYLMTSLNVSRIYYLVLVFVCFLVFSIPQVYPESAARYFIQIPFYVFGIFLIFESEYVGRKS